MGVALRFLRNPKVSFLPVDTKRQFLLSKGLTSDQVSAALAAHDAAASALTSTPPRLGWTWQELGLVLGLTATGGYLLYKYLQFYYPSAPIMKMMRARPTSSAKQLERIHNKLGLLETRIAALEKKMDTDMPGLQRRMQQLNTKVVSAVDELQTDVANVKTMLLRPKATLSPRRNGLPDWQRQVRSRPATANATATTTTRSNSNNTNHTAHQAPAGTTTAQRASHSPSSSSSSPSSLSPPFSASERHTATTNDNNNNNTNDNNNSNNNNTNDTTTEAHPSPSPQLKNDQQQQHNSKSNTSPQAVA
ncbi:hypothetical protein PTSG_11181 [Salpingoeca rosetta]|uniref:Peroxisomal membrane protein PEX14 n=1 Tax=Salpingoeca rosetta (strain ATCC 50818 / BSB-021) TaxID=946362 RepID=F2USN4_SALR5|nr:uncharacterized protein PTSG_11181 [Salpingoeca rosetta]EGD81143.1 hypothetical protein PTSG_11181 [Salpingoeca rosetta]|eukprot:XP_004987828.1 hypothetical protein PTSG_11181 [Salpingoeca rosetta]